MKEKHYKRKYITNFSVLCVSLSDTLFNLSYRYKFFRDVWEIYGNYLPLHVNHKRIADESFRLSEKEQFLDLDHLFPCPVRRTWI
jgi:hypothetical protein